MGKQECSKSQESSPLRVGTEYKVSQPNFPNSFMFFRVRAPSLNSPRRATVEAAFFLRIREGQPGSVFQSKKKKKKGSVALIL